MLTVLLVLIPLFPALCAAACWLWPALAQDDARKRFVMTALCLSFAMCVAIWPMRATAGGFTPSTC